MGFIEDGAIEEAGGYYCGGDNLVLYNDHLLIRSKARYGVQCCIFRRRQKIQVNLARNVGHLRPDKKDNLTAVLLSREDDNAGAPIEDDGRDGSGESRLDAAYCN